MSVMILTFSVFLLGYIFIVLENVFENINKSAVALCSSFFIWCILISNNYETVHFLDEAIAEAFQILFFLMGALTIVEYIDRRDGFVEISKRLSRLQGSKFLIAISCTSFFVSSILDNMTTCIVMSLLTKTLIKHKEHRWFAFATILLSCNIGGAFTPIGDITTTMLWIKGLITTRKIITSLFVPCAVASIVSTYAIIWSVKRTGESLKVVYDKKDNYECPCYLPLLCGVVALISIPILKSAFGFPPFLTIMGAVGIIWLVDELIVVHRFKKHKKAVGMFEKIKETDLSPILFFYGILLSISGLSYAGVLKQIANMILGVTSNYINIAFSVGLVSAFVDNVPIVASMSYMFDLNAYPVDSNLWLLLAFTAGVGGNILILGSAAGVALLGVESVSFTWFVRKISWISFVSYISGIAVFVLQRYFFA